MPFAWCVSRCFPLGRFQLLVRKVEKQLQLTLKISACSQQPSARGDGMWKRTTVSHLSFSQRPESLCVNLQPQSVFLDTSYAVHATWYHRKHGFTAKLEKKKKGACPKPSFLQFRELPHLKSLFSETLFLKLIVSHVVIVFFWGKKKGGGHLFPSCFIC